MKFIVCLTGSFFLVSVNLVSISNLSAQSPPAAGSSPPSIQSDGAPTAAVTFPSGASAPMRSRSGRFPLVASSPGQAVTVKLQLPPGAARNLVVQSLDGNALSAGAQTSAIAADGSTSFQFQPGARPGVYRVLLNDGGTMTLLQFWVADPQNPRSNPPTVQAH
jgi:hypothetical protein